MPSRREFLAGAIAVVATACTGGSNKGPSPLPSGRLPPRPLGRAAPARFPAAGRSTVAGVGPGGPSQGIGIPHVYVGDTPPNPVGSKATSVATPVATTEHGLREICTRRPPDPMHSISLADALKNG